MCDKAMKQSHRVGSIFFVHKFFLRVTSQLSLVTRTTTECWFSFLFSAPVSKISCLMDESVVY